MKTYARRGSAANDAACEDPVISRHEVEQWARHAHAANGFGDPAITAGAAPALRKSHRGYTTGRACNTRSYRSSRNQESPVPRDTDETRPASR